jgi:hypothetical protein
MKVVGKSFYLSLIRTLRPVQALSGPFNSRVHVAILTGRIAVVASPFLV